VGWSEPIFMPEGKALIAAGGLFNKGADACCCEDGVTPQPDDCPTNCSTCTNSRTVYIESVFTGTYCSELNTQFGGRTLTKSGTGCIWQLSDQLPTETILCSDTNAIYGIPPKHWVYRWVFNQPLEHGAVADLGLSAEPPPENCPQPGFYTINGFGLCDGQTGQIKVTDP
jgi:hypothetical protein